MERQLFSPRNSLSTELPKSASDEDFFCSEGGEQESYKHTIEPWLDETNLLSFPMTGSSEWTTLLRKECFAAIAQPTSDQNSSGHNRTVLISAMVSLALLTVATFLPSITLSGGTVSHMSPQEAPSAQPGRNETNVTETL